MGNYWLALAVFVMGIGYIIFKDWYDDKMGRE